jgi:hypothetical protein
MPLGVWNVEWLNQNSQRAFPLTLDATRLDLSSTFEIPNSFILDLYFPVSLSLAIEPAKFFLRRVSSFSSGYSLVLGYAADSGSLDVASVLIPRISHTAYQIYALAGIGDFADSVGQIVIGGLDEIDQQPAGDYEFDLAGGRLELDPIRPQLRGISSLTVVNGDVRSDPIYDAAEFVAGNNSRLAVILETGQAPAIQFSFIDGEGSLESCLCDDVALGPAIRRINLIPANAAGDFFLQVGECMTLTGITNGLKLIDTCSKPCCTDVELQRIVDDMKTLGDRIRTGESIGTRLEAVMDQTLQTFLGSRLADGGCSL